MELRLGCESLKDFHVEQGRYTNKMIKDIAFTDVRILGTSVIALFVERGHVTGHCYQPAVNHRDLQFDFILNDYEKDGIKQRALQMCLVKPEQNEAFDIGSPINWYFYEVANDDDGTSLRSHGHLLPPAIAASGDSILSPSYGVVRGRTGRLLSGSTFKRMLNLFGYQWFDTEGNEHDGTHPPSLYELAKFLELFKDYELRDATTIKKFIKDFGLMNVYSYDGSISAGRNARYLGQAIRTLCPLRSCVFEGQHRAYYMTLFSTGFYRASEDMFLDHNAEFDDVWNSKWYGENQMWKAMTIRVGIPCDNSKVTKAILKNRTLCDRELAIMEVRNWEKAIEAFHAYGIHVNLTSAKGVHYDWSSFIVELVNTAQQRKNSLAKHKKWGDTIEEYDFSSFFAKGTKFPTPRLTAFYEELCAVFEKQEEYKAIAKGQSDWDALVKSGKGSFVNKGQPLSSDHKSLNFATFCTLLKYLCLESSKIGKLLVLAKPPIPRVPQRSSVWADYKHQFHSIDWMRHYLYNPLLELSKDIWIRLSIEKYIIAVLRSQLPLKQYRACLSSYDFSDIPHVRSFDPKLFASQLKSKRGTKAAKAKENEVDASSIYKKGTNITNRIHYAIMQSILVDILDCLQRFGYDPDLFPDNAHPTKSLYLRSYLE